MMPDMKKKEFDKFLELASLEDLRSFARSYAKTHKRAINCK